MNCPFCHKPVTSVTNSRPTRENFQIWRRRQCQSCKAIFTTHEVVDLSHLVVIKKSGKPEMFDHMKFYKGVYLATVDKTVRQIKKVDLAVREVEMDILFLKKKRVKSTEIGDLVLRRLRKIDTGMFLRFLAYYKDITNESEMKRELNRYLPA